MMCRAPGPHGRGRLSLPVRAALMCIWTALGAGCASNSGLTGLPAASESTGLSVDDLMIVDCLLPGIPHRMGNTVFTTGRRLLKITAHECALYAGEYVLRGSRDTALEKWLPDAQAGDPKAQAYVGELYERGLGIEPDYTRAAEWYRKAAEQGQPRAQASLGVLYEKGLGVPKDLAMALEWKRRAAGPTTPMSLSPEVSAELRAAREQLEQRSEQFKRSEAELARTKQELDKTKPQLERLQSGAGTTNAPRVNDLVKKITEMQEQLAKRGVEIDDQSNQIFELKKRIDGNLLGASGSDPNLYGRYHALVIGINDYRNPPPPLKTALHDAEEIAALLDSKYGFKVQLLRNPTKRQFYEALHGYRKSLGETDNLLIYYAGHGHLDKGLGNKGFWLFADAIPGADDTWMAHREITDYLDENVIKARHILVIADSCYAGGLTRSSIEELSPGISDEERASWLVKKAQNGSRTALTSGGLEPVLDTGGGDNSVFARVLIDTLRRNDAIIDAQKLSSYIGPKVRFRAEKEGGDQTPEYRVIRGAGDETGDFIFVPITKRRIAFTASPL